LKCTKNGKPTHLQIADKFGMRGSVHISQTDVKFTNDLNTNFSVDQWLTGRIINVDKRYGLKISLKKLTTSETPTKLPSIKANKPESDIAIKLRNALIKKENT